jgi:lysophospholipase L1-like esterase
MRYEYHPDYNWKLKTDVYKTKNGPIQVNSHGLRGSEVVVPKPADRLRVLAMGGSSTFNYSATNGRTWSHLLELYLEEHLQRGVEVINCGTPGYSAYQSSKLLEHLVVKFEPDLVLVYHLWNDLKLFSMKDTSAMVHKWDKHGKANAQNTILEPTPVLDDLSEWVLVVSLARFAWMRLQLLWRRMTRSPKVQKADAEGWVHSRLDKSVSPAGVAFYRSNLARMVDVTASHGVSIGLIEQALLIRPDNTEAERAKISYKYLGFGHQTLIEAIDRARQVQRELASSEHATLITTKGIGSTEESFRDHVHLTDRGREKLVEVIGPQVARILR